MIRRTGRGAVRRRVTSWSAVAVAALVVTVGSGCGVGGDRGVEFGHLRDLARRVEGGGAECPLDIPESAIRPATVAHDAPILPLRGDGPAAQGFVGTEGPTDGVVRISCRYRVEKLSVRIALVGVPKGHAIADFGDRLTRRASGATVLTFIDVNGELPVGRARSLPGTPPAAFTRVKAAKGDVALVLSIDRLDTSAELPDDADVRRKAVEVAASLSA